MSPSPSRGVVRGLKMLLLTVLLAVAGVGLALILYFTPAMSARNIVVSGTGAVTREEVLDAAKVRPGTPLLQINTNQVADRVAAIRRVASARVQRQYPSALRITIVERVPMVVKDLPDGPHLFDRDGVDFATAPPPPALPYIDVADPGPTDPDYQGSVGRVTCAAARGGRPSGPDRGPVGVVDHPHAGRRAGSDLGEHRPRRREGREAGRVADTARADLRHLQPRLADGEVARRKNPRRVSARLHG